MPSGSLDFFTLEDFDLSNKTVFVRLDINSPINPVTGEILGFQRFQSHLDTLKALNSSKVILLAHQSRPGKDDFVSLREHARQLERMLGKKITFIDHLFGDDIDRFVKEMASGDILMLENTRFYSEEVSIDENDIETMEQTNIVKRLSRLMDYYVMDAFPAIHRPQTTLIGFRRKVPNIAGKLVEREIRALQEFSMGNEHPKIAVLSGAKINESITVAKGFLGKSIVDKILVGGVVANAFLWASGKDIGKRNTDFIIKNNKNYKELLEQCKTLLERYKKKLVIPSDFILNPSEQRISSDEEVPQDQIIADIGVESIATFSSEIARASNVFLNGPLGMYELDQYSAGTREIFLAVASCHGHTIAGGGHTLSALDILGLLNKIGHASTGGGALISYLSGEKMPVLEALRESRKIFRD